MAIIERFKNPSDKSIKENQHKLENPQNKSNLFTNFKTEKKERAFFEASLIGKVTEGLLAIVLKITSPQWQFEPVLTLNGNISTPDHVFSKVVKIDGKNVLVEIIFDSKMQDSEQNRNKVYSKYSRLFDVINTQKPPNYSISVKILGIASLLSTEGEYAELMYENRDIISLNIQSSELIDRIINFSDEKGYSDQLIQMMLGDNQVDLFEENTIKNLKKIKTCFDNLESIKILVKSVNFRIAKPLHKQKANEEINRLVNYTAIWNKNLSREYLKSQSFGKNIKLFEQSMQNLTNLLKLGNKNCH